MSRMARSCFLFFAKILLRVGENLGGGEKTERREHDPNFPLTTTSAAGLHSSSEFSFANWYVCELAFSLHV